MSCDQNFCMKFFTTPKSKKIVYKNTDEWYIEWQRVVQRVTTNDNEWQRMTTSGTTSDNEWYTSDNEWQRVTTSDNEWQRVTTSGTTSDNECQRVTIPANFSFFFK